MIVPDAVNLGSVLRSVLRSIVFLLAFDIAVAVAYVCFGVTWVSLPHVPLSLFGSAIGVILGFRNNSCYARWWEARILWGSIVNYSRTFARQALSMIVVEETDPAYETAIQIRQRLVLLQVAYVHSLRLHLRGQAPWEGLDSLYPKEQMEVFRTYKNVPVYLQQEMSELLSECYSRGWVDNIRWAAMDGSLAALMNAQGGAERIKNTPMPLQYDSFPRLLVGIYCLLLPLAIVANLGLMTPIGSTLVGLIFLAFDQIGRDLEDPFENSKHDVPMTAIAKTIEINLKQLLKYGEIPEPEKPVRGVLW
jgi:putative membrane protein